MAAALLSLELCVFSYVVEPNLLVSRRAIRPHVPAILQKPAYRVFSPDGRRLVYVARAGKKRFVVVDGEERNRYDRVEVQSFAFSPNSQRLAYAARDKNGWFEWKWDLVVDGGETIHLGGFKSSWLQQEGAYNPGPPPFPQGVPCLGRGKWHRQKRGSR